MPRKSYRPKNRFCLNSNQSEWGYLKIIYLWLRGYTMSEIERFISVPNEEFSWFFERASIERKMKDIPNIEEPEGISRQSIHKILARFSHHILELRFREKAHALRKFASNPEALAAHESLADFPFIRRFLLVAQKLGLMGKLSNQLNELDWRDMKSRLGKISWELASGNVDYEATLPIFGIRSPETTYPAMCVYLVKERYRACNGFSFDNMDVHTAFEEITIQAIRYLYKKHRQLPKLHPSEMNFDELENLRANIAITGLTHVINDLLTAPVGSRIKDPVEE